MESYAAVVTTGVYCRPDGGARPRADHGVRFRLAASAEAAGYRACLRCRPYRSPQPAAIAGPEIVCRAVRLILDGSLDGAGEATLSARLGVSARHLRRLFAGHLGVTPDGLARSARTHLARRLLDDTDLPLVEVAFAAGFGSLRRFNRSCLAVFGMTPSQLGARRGADRLVADGGLVLRLPYRGALDWEAILCLLAERATAGVTSSSAPTAAPSSSVGTPGVLELSAGGHDHLVLRLHRARWEERSTSSGRARRPASLGLDLEAAIRQLAGDPALGPLVARRPGLRPPGTWDPFATGVRAVIDSGHDAGPDGRRRDVLPSRQLRRAAAGPQPPPASAPGQPDRDRGDRRADRPRPGAAARRSRRLPGRSPGCDLEVGDPWPVVAMAGARRHPPGAGLER